MRTILCPNIYFELTREEASGYTTTQYFGSVDVAGARRLVLKKFLQITLYEGVKAEEEFVSVYCHQLATGRRLKLICTGTYGQPFDYFRDVLQTELCWFNDEGVTTNVALFKPETDPEKLTIVLNRTERKIRGTENKVAFVADQYNVFFPQRDLKISYKVA